MVGASPVSYCCPAIRTIIHHRRRRGTVVLGRDIDVLPFRQYMVKEEASVLIRLEIAKGKNDNEALYLRFGHAF